MVFSKSHNINDITIASANPGANSFDQLPLSWYPVATSHSLKKGQKRALRFLDKEWLIFRNSNGKLGVISRYCSHMGTDLSNGFVDTKHIVCPLHHWCFDTNGHCQSDLPQPFLQQAKLPSLATEESAGVIYVFPSIVASYPLPKLQFNNGYAISTSATLNLPIHHLFPSMNTFDVAHYGIVHNRKIIGSPVIYSDDDNHLGIELTAQVIQKKWQDRIMYILGLGTVNITINCWGTTILHMYNVNAKLGAVVAIAPINESSSTLYITAYDTNTASNFITKPLKRLKLELSRLMTIAFLKSDIPVGRKLKPKEGVLIPGQDDIVKQFWQYYKQLPKIKREDED